jgi:DNA (cytosine-5)-methyltransferase 1
MPRTFVMENVKALGTMDKWKAIRNKYLHEMEKIGYNVRYYILNSSDHNVPQKRERVFFIGIRKDIVAHFTIWKP